MERPKNTGSRTEAPLDREPDGACPGKNCHECFLLPPQGRCPFLVKEIRRIVNLIKESSP